MTSQPNIYEIPLLREGCEHFTLLFQNDHLKIESIRSWLKIPGEWYDQDEDEWVILLEGEAHLEIAQTKHILSRGEYLFIPKHTKHRVLSTSENSLWLAIFSS